MDKKRKRPSPANLAKVGAALRNAEPAPAISPAQDGKVTQLSAARRLRSAPAPEVAAPIRGGGGEPPRGGGPGGPGDTGGGDEGPDDYIVIDGKAPLRTARQWTAAEFVRDGYKTLVHWRGDFFLYESNFWRMIKEQELKNRAYRWLAKCRKPADQRKTVDYEPNQRAVVNVIDALKSVVELRDRTDAPTWLQSDDPDVRKRDAELPPVSNFIVVGNGIFDLGEDGLWPPMPAYFATIGSPVAYLTPAATGEEQKPTTWLEFLHTIWPDDEQSIQLLQEFFGYCLTADTSQQKMLFMIGPPRSGKGTITRVLTALIGDENSAGPTLGLLGSPFGVATLIGKSVAIVSDARLDRHSNKASIIETLLTVSGEDFQTLDRKHMAPWTGRLPTRFVLASNELPELADASGALSSRLLLLHMRETFEGKEDHGLSDRLAAELSAILAWAIEGRRRLTERGLFVQPASAANLLGFFKELSQDVGSFVRECCDLAELEFDEEGRPKVWVDVEVLFARYKQWCVDQGISKVSQVTAFGRKLRASCPKVEDRQYRAPDKVRRRYVGIKLKIDESQLL